MEGRGLKYRKNESTTFMDGPFAQYPPSMLLLLNGHRLMQAMMTLHSAICSAHCDIWSENGRIAMRN